MTCTLLTKAKVTNLIASVYLLGFSSLSAYVIQDFEVDNSGVTPLLAPGEIVPPGGIANRVSTGVFIPTGPSAEQGGSFFAEVALLRDDGTPPLVAVQGSRLRWNDGTPSGGYVSGYGHSIDIYFDDPFFYQSVDGFFYQPTILDNTNTTDVNAGGFGVRLIDEGGGNRYWQVGADGDSKGYTGIVTTGSNTFYDISTAGWYTLETTWQDNILTGNIDQVNRLIEISTGSVVYTAV
ncbi:MAG: hypothetical protein ACPGSB_10440, partial [Opitutales bacterium]